MGGSGVEKMQENGSVAVCDRVNLVRYKATKLTVNNAGHGGASPAVCAPPTFRRGMITSRSGRTVTRTVKGRTYPLENGPDNASVSGVPFCGVFIISGVVPPTRARNASLADGVCGRAAGCLRGPDVSVFVKEDGLMACL